MTARQRRHKRLVNAAIADGRLVEASRAAWMVELARRGTQAERVLASLVAPYGAGSLTDLPWFPRSVKQRGAAS